jgi:flavin reductase (DIM6/NTAB) family NADH-FMN oxidoreductase RutF
MTGLKQEASMETEDRAAAFKHAFRMHPAGVAVVTTKSKAGPQGLTVSSVASVGVAPLAVAFSVASTNGSAGAVLGAERFVISLLTADHADLARAFASSGAPRFTPEQQWGTLDTGEPYLPTARAAFVCEPLHVVPVGESSLVIAEVIRIQEGEDVPPLVYHDRQFTTVSRDGIAL